MNPAVRLVALLVPFLLILPAQAAPPPGVIDVRETGAVGDGQALCTAAIQSAIDRCAAAGGGTVYFPAGTYRSGGVGLKSFVTLHLDAGATLLGSAEPKDYPQRAPALRSYTDNYVRQALLYGERLQRVAIRGGGTINGNGAAFHWKEYRDRPYVIRLVQCEDVVVEDVTLRDSPMWMQHYLACDRVRIRGVRVFNHVGYNNDGIDIDGCHDVAISDSFFDSDDDALCLKSTLERVCENVVVTNCVLSSHCNAFKLGTESNGGFRNIVFSNSAILSPRFSKSTYGVQRGMAGIALETVDGGHTENITVSNIAITGVAVPIFVRLGDRARPAVADAPRPAVGTLRAISIQGVVARGTGRIGCSITGLPGHDVEDVSIANVSLEFEGGGARSLAGKEVAEKADAYPESRMFGDLPAYGFFARHVRGLRLTDVRLETATPDARHAIVCDDVRELELAGLHAPAAPDAAALVRCANVVDAVIRNIRTREPIAAMLRLEGPGTSGIVVLCDGDATAARSIDVASDISPRAWRMAGR